MGIDVTLEARTGSVDETRAVSGALAEIAAPPKRIDKCNTAAECKNQQHDRIDEQVNAS